MLYIVHCLLTDFTRASIVRKICDDLTINIEDEQVNNEASTSQSISSARPEKNAENSQIKSSFIHSLLNTHCPEAVRHFNTLECELQSFKEMPAYTDCLEFWKKYSKNYPKLAAVARVVLSLPLTTSASEGSFSVSGCLIRSRRASITPSRVEKVLFIHDNFHLFNSP